MRYCVSDFIKMQKEYADNPFLSGRAPSLKDFERLETYYEELAAEEAREALNKQRPHVTAFLTWNEVWQIGSERAGLGQDSPFLALKEKVRRPLSQLKPLLTRAEMEEFKTWLRETEPRYAAQRKREREEAGSGPPGGASKGNRGRRRPLVECILNGVCL